MRIEDNLAAIVLAGGYSSRAPGFKPLLPFGRSTVLENTVQVFRRAGVSNITVVVGHNALALIPLLNRLEVRYVFNELYHEGMYTSVVSGVRALDKAVKAFFLLPADMPLVKSHTVKLISRAYKKAPYDIIYPVFAGERGHPPLIATKLASAVLAWTKPGGLRNLLAQYEGDSYELEVFDEGILLDLDTSEDYEALKHYRCGVPTAKECQAALRQLGVAEPIIRHGKVVSRAAVSLASHLNQAGLTLDIGLVAAAALLHDIAKGTAHHAERGARILRKFGYFKTAAIVAQHTDFAFSEAGLLDETAVVYLADKVVKGERLVSVAERFKPALDKYAGDHEVLSIINKRYLCTTSVAEAIEGVTGKRLADMLTERQVL